MSSNSRLTKHARQPHDDWPMYPADQDEAAGGKVTYLSTNTRDGRQFEAVCPPNSVHAAQLAEIALLVQSNERSGRSNRKHVASLKGTERIIAQIAPAANQTQPAPLPTYATSPRAVREVYETNAVHAQPLPSTHDASVNQEPAASHAICNCSASPNPHEHVPVIQSGGQYVQSVGGPLEPTILPTASQAKYNSYPQQTSITSTQPLIQTPEVYRYGTDQSVGYRVVTGTGEMRVSAPIGSSEAQAFNGVVERMSAKVSKPAMLPLNLKNESLDLVPLTML